MANRRPKGDGSITKRKDGGYMGRVWIHDRGRRVRHCVYGRTQTEVSRKIDELQDDDAQRLGPSDAKVTLQDFTVRWLAGADIRPSTRRSYQKVLDSQVLPFLGHVPVRSLTPLRLESWKQQRLTDGARPASVKYARVVLRAALSQAQRWHLVATNAAKLTTPVKATPREYPTPTVEQLTALLMFAAGHRLEAAIWLGVLGLREGEVLGMSWRDVDLHEGTVLIRLALVVVHEEKKKQSLVLGPPKSKTSRRVVPLPPAAVAALKAQHTGQLEARLRAGGKWQDWQGAGLVFTTASGSPWQPRNLLRDFRTLLAAAGLPRFRFHDLRHACGTALMLAGEQPRVIKDLLGHSDVRLTLNTYQSRVDSAVRAATDRLEIAVTPPPSTAKTSS